MQIPLFCSPLVDVIGCFAKQFRVILKFSKTKIATTAEQTPYALSAGRFPWTASVIVVNIEVFLAAARLGCFANPAGVS
jgi:hypothetical protein